MLQVFYLDVAYVCNCFQVSLGVFASVSDSCFKYFIYLQTYVASVAFRCFKSKSGCCTCSNMTRLLQLLEEARGVGRGVDAAWGSGWDADAVWGRAVHRVQAWKEGASVGVRTRTFVQTSGR